MAIISTGNASGPINMHDPDLVRSQGSEIEAHDGWIWQGRQGGVVGVEVLGTGLGYDASGLSGGTITKIAIDVGNDENGLGHGEL